MTERDRPGPDRVEPALGRRDEKALRHEQNKRTTVELTAWIAAVAVALVVGLQALLTATATAPDVPRVSTGEYRR